MTRVLIVDDKEESRAPLRALLQDRGYDVVEARHGAEALAQAGRTPPDIVISDLLMPLMDGYTLLRRWKADERWRRIPFVVYTATYTDPEDAQLAFDLGADAFIVGPADPESVLARLHDVLGGRTREGRSPSRSPLPEEAVVLEQYSETLVHKLEQKAARLEQATRTLRLSEERFRTTLRSIGDAVITTGTTGHVTLLNPVAEALTGWSEAEALGRPLEEIFPIVNEDTRRRVESPVARVLREGTVVGLANHTMLLARDGREIPIADAGAPIFDDEGRITGVVLVFRDQTAERAAHRAVADARRFAESIVDTVREGLLVLDADLRVVAANRGFYQTFRVTPEQTLGRRVYELGDGQWDIPALRQLLEDILPRNTQFEDFEVEHEFRGIGRHAVRLNARRLYQDDQRSQMMLLAFEDVTARKQAEAALRESEERFRLLVDHAPEAIVLLDAETGRFIHSNPAAERLFKLPAAELARLGPIDLSPPAQPDGQPSEARARMLIGAALAGEKPVFEWMHRDATGRDVLCEVRLLRMDFGGRTIVRGSVQDISERKAAEARIRQLSRTYAVLSDINQAIVRDENPQTLLASACRIAVDKGGFPLAWIGLTEADQRLRITAHAGATPDTLAVLRNLIEGEQPDCTFTYHALRRSERAICLDIAGDERTRIWRDAALARSYAAMASLPLRVGGRTAGTFNLYAARANFFDDEELQLLDELAADIGFALETYQLERERQHAEQALHELIRTVDGIVWEADPDTLAFTFVSRHAERLLGYPVERWLSEPDFWANHLHPEDRERAVSLCAASTRAGKDHQLEYRMLASDGRAVYVRDLVTVTLDNGRPAKMRGIMVDVTAAKEAEAALRASEERFREIAETIADVFWVTDPETHRILYVSPAYERIWGRSAQRLYASPRDWLEAIHPEDRPPVEDAVATRLTTGDYDVEFRIVRPDGEVRWIRDVAFPVRDASGRVVRIVGVARDVTALKQGERILQEREERFRLLIENAPDMIHVIDSVGTLSFQSPSAEKTLGYSGEERLNRSIFDLIHPDDLAAAREALGQAASRPGHLVKVESRFRHKNGRWRVLEAVGRALPERAGRGLIVINSRDITERRQLEEQLRQSQKLEAIGQLAGGVAHDFNNILAAIFMQTQFLEMTPGLPADLAAGLKEIRAAADRAANLTRQLLLFSRRQVMQPRDVDVNDAVTSLTKMLQRIIGEDVRLELKLNPTPLWTRADPGMLDQVVLNLAVNARDAMPEGGQLQIETLRTFVDEVQARRQGNIAPGDYVGLRVSDTGGGIAPDILPRIFEPFFTTKAPGKGTGLGLATVFGIVKQHGGWLDVDSEANKGSTFYVWLPATTAPVPDETTARSAVRGGSETILLVEDDAAVRAITRVVLERHGYRVLQAANGPEAVEVWNQHQGAIDLLFTDMVMPEGMSGRELAGRLREGRPDLAVVFTSGYSVDVSQLAPLQRRQRFIQKPASPDVLLHTIRICLDER